MRVAYESFQDVEKCLGLGNPITNVTEAGECLGMRL